MLIKKKIYFVVQGEGRGHLTQALALKGMLEKRGHSIVGLSVGQSSQRKIPDYFYQKVKCKVEHFESPNFITDKNGKGIIVWRSILNGIRKSPRFIKSVFKLRKSIETSNADLVINFYEPICGLIQIIKKLDIPVYGIAHQYLAVHSKFILPNGFLVSKNALLILTKITSIAHQYLFALSFYKLENEANILVVPPLLRDELYQQKKSQGEHILVYLLNKGYSQDVIKWHEENPTYKLEVFWDNFAVENGYSPREGLVFHHLDDELFLQKMASCYALLTTAGFESICEAMYLNKPVMMVPTKGHYEQFTNSFDALIPKLGVRANDFDIAQLMDSLQQYLKQDLQQQKKLNQDWLSFDIHPIVKAIENA